MDVMQVVVVTYPASLPETPRFPSPHHGPIFPATAAGKGYQQGRWMHRWLDGGLWSDSAGAQLGSLLMCFPSRARRNGPSTTVSNIETFAFGWPLFSFSFFSFFNEAFNVLWTKTRVEESSKTLSEGPLLGPRPGGGAVLRCHPE